MIRINVTVMLCSLLAICLVMSGFAKGEATTQPAWNEISLLLASPDAARRRVAARQMAVNKPEERSAEVLAPLLITALADEDQLVRSYGAASAARATSAAFAFKAEGAAEKANLSLSQRVKNQLALAQELSLNPALEKALVNAIDDSAEQVRENGIVALAGAFEPSPEIEKKLIDRFPKEASAKVREAIVNAINVSGYSSDEAIGILLLGLRDSSPQVKGWSAEALGKLRPAAGLSALVEAMVSSNDLFVKQKTGSAIVAYGAAAKAYVRQLKQELERIKQLETQVSDTIKAIEQQR